MIQLITIKLLDTIRSASKNEDHKCELFTSGALLGLEILKKYG